MPVDKKLYFKDAAKRFAASAILYKADSVVHVEDIADIWFWEQVLNKYRPGNYKFLPASINEKGNKTTGCTQCLKYKDYLTRKFFICIDSDLRYLLREDISASQGILQTYTYSWENHCAFASELQQSFSLHTGKGAEFDFEVFLRRYSAIVYKPLLLMLYQERNGLKTFDRDKFRRCISLQHKKGDETNNGSGMLMRLSANLAEAVSGIIYGNGFDAREEAVLYSSLGLKEENAYLYVRGHCLYDSLLSIGKKLCRNTGVDFEENILKPSLAFDRYDEISRIEKDIHLLDQLRKEL